LIPASGLLQTDLDDYFNGPTFADMIAVIWRLLID